MPRPGTSGPAVHGRRTGSRPWQNGESSAPVDIGRTINAYVARRAGQKVIGQNPPLAAADLHLQLRCSRPQRLTVFVIDTSDSMGDGPVANMSAALGAVAALAARAYLEREKVCLITFRDRHAQLVVPPTNSVMRIRQQLDRLPVGGATPLAAGLRKAGQVIEQAKRKDQAVEPLLVLISDGDATVPLHTGADPAQEALDIAQQLGQEPLRALVLDTTPGHLQRNLMPRIAAALGTVCQQIHNLRARSLLELVATTRNSAS